MVIVNAQLILSCGLKFLLVHLFWLINSVNEVCKVVNTCLFEPEILSELTVTNAFNSCALLPVLNVNKRINKTTSLRIDFF